MELNKYKSDKKIAREIIRIVDMYGIPIIVEKEVECRSQCGHRFCVCHSFSVELSHIDCLYVLCSKCPMHCDSDDFLGNAISALDWANSLLGIKGNSDITSMKIETINQNAKWRLYES